MCLGRTCSPAKAQLTTKCHIYYRHIRHYSATRVLQRESSACQVTLHSIYISFVYVYIQLGYHDHSNAVISIIQLTPKCVDTYKLTASRLELHDVVYTIIFY